MEGQHYFGSFTQVAPLVDLVSCILRNAEPANMDKFADHLAGHYVPNSVIVDATASEVPAQNYLDWMRKGIHVITPNKKLNSGPLSQYRELKKFQRDSYIHFLYEVRPGAKAGERTAVTC